MYSYLSNSQKLAFDAINEGKNVFVSGSAGTGKSYLLSFLKKNFKIEICKLQQLQELRQLILAVLLYILGQI